MTDRYAGFVVTLAHDIREDDARDLVTALRMIRGVVSVDPVTADAGYLIAEMRADAAWRTRILAAISNSRDPWAAA